MVRGMLKKFSRAHGSERCAKGIVYPGTPLLEERREKTKDNVGIERLRRGRDGGCFILLSCVALPPTYCLCVKSVKIWCS